LQPLGRAVVFLSIVQTSLGQRKDFLINADSTLLSESTKSDGPVSETGHSGFYNFEQELPAHYSIRVPTMAYFQKLSYIEKELLIQNNYFV
jgi:hypothetical protein